jgi:hypothetical protein
MPAMPAPPPTWRRSGDLRLITVALTTVKAMTKKAYDLLLRGLANAKANGRDVIEPWDLPITKGFQESCHAYRRINEQIELEPILH